MKAALALAAWMTSFSGPSVQAAPGFSYSNPLPFTYSEGQTESRREVRDPCIVREGDTYFLVFTMWPFAGREAEHLSAPDQGSSPGIALYASKDLKNWKFENWLVKSSDLPESCPYKNRFWAPEIHKIAGKFYLIFTADNWLKPEYNPAGNWGMAGYAFVGVADRIDGPYRHITHLEGGACDTSLFEDEDGKIYAIIPRHSIDIQQIDLSALEHDKVRLLGQPITVLSPDQHDIGFHVAADYLEGPWMEKIGGAYTLFYAEIFRDQAPAEWRGYWMGIATAGSVTGPYRKDPKGKIFLGGHVAVFHGPDGAPWISYRSEVPGSPARGLLCVDPLRFDTASHTFSVSPTVGPPKP